MARTEHKKNPGYADSQNQILPLEHGLKWPCERVGGFLGFLEGGFNVGSRQIAEEWKVKDCDAGAEAMRSNGGSR
jgi:hypothetical protein